MLLLAAVLYVNQLMPRNVMSSLLKSLSVLLFTLSITSHAAELSFTATDGFELKADYYQPTKLSKRAVLLLHQCNFNRSMYNDIGAMLSARGLHAVSLDFRGFGESISDKFDRKKLRSLSREERIKAFRAIREYWPNDVQLAYDFLREKVGESGVIGVAGASCGGAQAKIIADNNPIMAMSFFSSAMTNGKKAIVDYTAKFSDMPTLMISAEKDVTYKFTKKAFEINNNKHSIFIAYKGKKHGHPLLKQDKNLSHTIAQWFDDRLFTAQKNK